MKRPFTILIILVIISTLMTTLVFSQTVYGFRGGLNLTNISENLGGSATTDFEGTPLELTLNQTNRTTYSIGGFIEFPLSSMFAVQINALYNQKGVGIKGNLNNTIVEQGIPVNVNVDVEETLKLTYISIPVLAKLVFGEKIKPYIMAGPEIGFLLSSKDNAKATSEAEAMGRKVGPYTVEQEQDIMGNLKTFELAINLGAGLMIPLGSVGIFVDAQYSLGLTKINKDSSPYSGDVKNNVITIDIGMAFGDI